MTNNKELEDLVNEIFQDEENSDKLDSIKGPWLLDEYRRSMYYIFDVRNNEDKLVTRFVADEETKDKLRAVAHLISRAPKMLRMLEEVEKDIEIYNTVQSETFKDIRAFVNEMEVE
ncbi:MAG: hypothetical protein BHK79_02720 [Halanaerobium sp. MDAL1]|nr:MAG: hypothetical protein BHK79_02720 [Halanaerobium sp. MDAL1]